jgi:hypothetical protein
MTRPRSPPDNAPDRLAGLFGREQEILHVADDMPSLAADGRRCRPRLG